MFISLTRWLFPYLLNVITRNGAICVIVEAACVSDVSVSVRESSATRTTRDRLPVEPVHGSDEVLGGSRSKPVYVLALRVFSSSSTLTRLFALFCFSLKRSKDKRWYRQAHKKHQESIASVLLSIVCSRAHPPALMVVVQTFATVNDLRRIALEE